MSETNGTTKVCTKCGETKPATIAYFYLHSNGVPCNPCKACVKANAKVWKRANREKVLQGAKRYSKVNKHKRHQYHENNKENISKKAHERYEKNKEAVALRNKEYRKANVEKVREWKRKEKRIYRLKYPDRIRRYKKQYYENNIENIRKYYNDNKDRFRDARHIWLTNNRDRAVNYSHTYTARKLGNTVEKVTRCDWHLMKLGYNNRCVYCGDATKKLTQDHIVPLSLGGAHCLSNIVPACGVCNSKKSARMWWDRFTLSKIE